MSYENLSHSFLAFISQLSRIDIPKNIQDDLNVPKWKEFVLEEMRAVEKNKTWEVMSLLEEKSMISYKWVFTMKYNFDISLEKYKAWLVAKGFT